MIDYSNLKRHALSEKIVNAISNKVGKDEKEFFRLHTSYYMSVLATSMHTDIKLPGSAPESTNMFVVNLAPSGYGKGHSTTILEEQVINKFKKRFSSTSFNALAEVNLARIALERSAAKNTAYDEEVTRVEKEFKVCGEPFFSFDSASSSAAIKQLRHKFLMANAGAVNLQMDEAGNNLIGNKEAMTLFLEMFGGIVKPKLIKNTDTSIRHQEIHGRIPTNMMLFGTPGALLDGGKTEEEFMAMLDGGYARRCFFGFVPDLKDNIKLFTPQERLKAAKLGSSDAILEQISEELAKLANPANSHKILPVPDHTALLYFEYQNDCLLRSSKFKEHEQLFKAEMQHRFYKALKVAGALAFVDSAPEVSINHLEAAILSAEESGESFAKIVKQERAYVKLARYLSNIDEEVTQTDLIEDLPLYKGTKQQKDDLITQAIAWGYKNNIIIKKRYTDSIEFFRGESLQSINLSKIQVSYSDDIAEGYLNKEVPFSKLYKLTQAKNMHWINHHLEGTHRADKFCLPGFNIVVIDVDGGVSLPIAKSLLTGYKALYYTTKRHTDTEHRFRIILPTNYQLHLDTQDFKEFMKNCFEWLPFDADTQTGQRSRKWLSHPGSYEYTKGKLLDVLPFIPKTVKNEERKKQFNSLQSLDNLERWVIQNTGDGNRNNQLLKYAYILADGGMNYDEIQANVFTMNDKLADKLDEAEILSTILTTINKVIASK